MAVICPTITAESEEEYARQINNVKDFAERIHIDLMDGDFAPTKSIDLFKVWWPKNIRADIHLMYKYPERQLHQLIALKPGMVIIHAEAKLDHEHFLTRLHAANIDVGLALLQDTSVESQENLIKTFDQILIFSGHLGYQGGQSDLNLITKVKRIREINKKVEIAWDGGINDQNSSKLAKAGIDVLNVGGYIQASSSPKTAYDKLEDSLTG